MNRVATVPIQRTLSDAIQRSQQKLAASQTQVATGKKVTDYAALGTESVRTLSARTLIEKQEAHASVARRLNTTLSIQDANLSDIERVVGELHKSTLTAIGTGKSAGLQESIEVAFSQFRTSLNGTEAGSPLFGGSRTDTPPFKPETLADTIGLAPADAFANDDVRAGARIADGLDVEFGILADEVGSQLFSAFRTLAEAGTIGAEPTAAQKTALEQATSQLVDGLKTLRGVISENGRKQVTSETMETRAKDRSVLLKELVAGNEDADLGQVAVELAQQQATLQASYSVFAQLSKLSLANYLR